MAGVFLVCAAIIFVAVLNCCHSHHFQHDTSFETNQGEHVYHVTSSGHTRNIINLDDQSMIKGTRCKEALLVVVTFDPETIKAWSVGDAVIGKATQECYKVDGEYNALRHVLEITLKSDNRAELSTGSLEFTHLFESLDVNFHYLGPHTRVKRRTAGIPSAIVGAVNLNMNSSETIKFNPDNKVFGIQKLSTQTSPIVFSDTSLPAHSDDMVFRVACESCSGEISMSYRLQIKLGRTTEKKVKIEAFVSEISGTVRDQLLISVKSTREASSFHNADILDTGVVDLVTIPLAEIHGLPPLMLNIKSQLVTSVAVDMVATGAMEARLNLQETGQFDVLHKRVSEEQMSVNATFTNWRFTGSNVTNLDTNDGVKVTATVTNKLRLIPSMSWSEKDVFWSFESPTIYSKSTHMHAYSSVDDQELCSSLVANSTGMIELEKMTTDITAFNFPLCCGDIGVTKQLGSLSDSTMNIKKICKAYCSGEEIVDVYDSLQDACGEPGNPVNDKTDALMLLDELFGDIIIFPSEEFTTSSWCGNNSTACPDCNVNDANNICSDRLVSSDMHMALTKLAKLVIAEWPLRKLMINEGWDEATEKYPNRQHGDTSLYYEGRAAAIGVSQDGNLARSHDEEVNRRFYQLIKCAGLHIGNSLSDGYTEVCVEKPVNHFRRKKSLRSRRSTGTNMDSNCKTSIWPCLDMFHDILSEIAPDYTKLSPQLGTLFQTDNTEYPSEGSVEDICGDIDETFSRDNMNQMKRLLQYPFDDLQFIPEGPVGQSCGSDTRRCVQDTSYSYSTDPLHWPSSRIMTPRLVSRLHTFYLLLSETDDINPCIDSYKYCQRVCIPEDWACTGFTRRKRHTENSKTIKQRGTRTKRSQATSELTLSKYQNNGRAIRIDLSDINVTMEFAASLAVMAGFDFVAIHESYLDLYVRNQAGVRAIITPFPLVNVIDVNHPTNSGEEYTLTDEALPLFDGHNYEQKLSDCYKISDIRNQGSQNRYFRFDGLLLQCLEEASYEYGSCIPIIKGSAYRTKSINAINIEERHSEEQDNFIRGKAVEIMPVNSKGDDPLYELGLTVIRTCTALLRLKQMKIGVGCHSDRLYVDIRQSSGAKDLLTLWDVDNPQLYGKMKQVHDDLFAGGPMIRPINVEKACKDPTLGSSLYYIRQPSSVLNACFNEKHEFCVETKAAREKAVQILLDNLVSVVGSGQFSEASIRDQVVECFVTHCGGCLGRGNIWIDKTKSCMTVVKTFLSALSLPFGGSLHDNAVFYNMDPRESNITSVACDGDNICFQDLQFYSILMTTLTETYEPNDDNDVEEALYGSADNPLPILDLLEQEMAMSASGVAKIYLESKDDLNALYPILKILMVYNRDVTEVEFHLTVGISHTLVISSLKNKIQRWSTSVCPSRSRIVVTPYKLIDIPADRRKRSTHKTSRTIRSKLRDDELVWLIRN